MYYIQPDYAVEQDSTNVIIKEALRDNQFINTFFPTVLDYSMFPLLKSIATEDIVTLKLPSLAVTKP